MSESSDPRGSGISQAASAQEIGEFWDSHSLANHWDETAEVDIEIRAERRRRITLAPEVYSEVEELARRKGILTETLVNLWLVERLRKAN
jgi:hypothetical protein